MTNEVIWTKLVLERFIELANLTEEEEIVDPGGWMVPGKAGDGVKYFDFRNRSYHFQTKKKI